MSRNYYTLATPRVFMSLLPQDSCADLVVEGPEHPFFDVNPAPTSGLIEAVSVYRDGLSDPLTAGDASKLSRYQMALVVESFGGDWAYHPTQCDPDYPDLEDDPCVETVERRVAALRTLPYQDYMALQLAVTSVLTISEDEEGNSDGA